MQYSADTRSPLVVIASPVHASVLGRLQAAAKVVANETAEPFAADALRARCRDADALMAFMPDRVDDAFLDACPRLRIVAGALKGYDNLDVEACTRHGVWLTVVPDRLTQPTAELAVGLMIALARNIVRGDRLVRSGGFHGWRPILYGKGIADSTVGLIGAGAIGQAIAERLAGFAARLLYVDRQRLPAAAESRLGLRSVGLEALLGDSDFVVLCLPLGPATRRLVDARFLARMKPGAFLVNPARGSLVDEEAVADALATGRLAGYAADVFALEDQADPDRPADIPHRLRSSTATTVFTPHLGSAVDRAREEIELAAAASILECLGGQEPSGAVNRPSRPRRPRAS